MRILVTGHMGVVGRQLARHFREDHDVHGCDQRAGTDCRDTFKINDLRYDLVFHCADEETSSGRLGLDADFLSWIDRTKPGKVVFFSSADVYPLALQQEPYRLVEEDAVPDTERGVVLRTAEELIESRGGYVFRPFEVYGEAGGGVFGDIAALIAERRDPFLVPSCGRVLDYIHVDDVVASVLASLDSPPAGPVNLCSGNPVAVDELALLMFEAVQWKPNQLLCDSNTEQIFRCGSIDRLAGIRAPKISLLDGILTNLPRTSI